MNPESTGVLLVTRDPAEIRRSFLRTNWRKNSRISKGDFVRRVKEHIDFARQIIDRYDIPFVEIEYSDYATRPEDIAGKLSNFFDLEISAEDIGYDSKLNTSSPRGYVAFTIERMEKFIPKSIRRVLKKLLPNSLLHYLFPNRF